MNVMLSGLAKIEFIKVMHYETTKEMWEKVRKKYQGDAKYDQNCKHLEANLKPYE